MSAPLISTLPEGATRGECAWLADKFLSLPTKVEMATPSEWAEKRRRLPEAVTPYPGPYRFEIAPYLREIVDCFCVDSPVREVAVLKGVQICFTTGVAENVLGYFIDEVKTAPVMWVTATDDMAKTRLEVNILPMIHHSGLDPLIASNDPENRRKTGRTDRKIEWLGGGCLLPFGAQSPNKFRQQPAPVLLCDELDGWPLVVNDGDPIELIRDRTAAYEDVRKILYGSTPTLLGQSKIAELYARGDRRQYFVCCVGCGHPQTLRWQRVDSDTGVVSGIKWQMDGERLVSGSVRYVCEHCGYEHTNDEKTKLLASEYGAEWRPTKEPDYPDFRSYHIPALLSPAGMQSWEACVLRYLKGWDYQANRPRDLGQYQTFYNNVLGKPFELKGSHVRATEVFPHRRPDYRYGQVPNEWARKHCGSQVLLLTCTVDVHKDNLAVTVFGWCVNRRCVLIDYWRFRGEPEHLDDAGTWGRLSQLLTDKVYTADDSKEYRPILALIDSGYLAPQVYDFCHEVPVNWVFPIKGVDTPPKNARYREFSQFETPHGQIAFNIHVDTYKTRLISLLRREWNGQGLQPDGHFNAPRDAIDEQLKELTREHKRPKIDTKTGRRIGWEWYRTAGTANELWDLLVYAQASLDIVAWDVCRTQLGLEETDWEQFWDFCIKNG